MAERANRLAAQKTRLGGVVITQDLEPSHQLVDRVFQQVEDGCVSWIPWVNLTSRSKEAQGTKRDVVIKMDNSGNLKASQKEEAAETSLTGDIKIRQALQRRALAYDLSRTIDYATMELWTETLFAHMLTEQPGAYKAVSIQQVQDADRRLWSLVSEETRGKVAVQSDGSKPLENAFKTAMYANEVRFLLQPLPRPNKPEPIKPPPKNDKDIKKAKKDHDKVKVVQLPDGCTTHTASGKPLCRNYNQGKCRFAQPGKRCKFGFHLCNKKGCEKPQPYHECQHL